MDKKILLFRMQLYRIRLRSSTTAAKTSQVNRNLWRGLFALIFSTLACRPVIAIGWNEFIFLFVLIAVLLGPPLYKFFRRAGEFWNRKQKDK